MERLREEGRWVVNQSPRRRSRSCQVERRGDRVGCRGAHGARRERDREPRVLDDTHDRARTPAVPSSHGPRVVPRTRELCFWSVNQCGNKGGPGPLFWAWTSGHPVESRPDPAPGQATRGAARLSCRGRISVPPRRGAVLVRVARNVAPPGDLSALPPRLPSRFAQEPLLGVGFSVWASRCWVSRCWVSRCWISRSRLPGAGENDRGPTRCDRVGPRLRNLRASIDQRRRTSRDSRITAAKSR